MHLSTANPRPRRTHRPAVRCAAAVVAALCGAIALLPIAASPASAATCPPDVAQHYSDVPLDHPFCREIANATLDGWVTGYPDGTFQPTASISRQAAAAMLWRAANVDDPGATPTPCDAANPSPFVDVPDDHPFCGHIRDTHLAGVFDGYPDGTFQPAQPITRQAVAAALVRFRYADAPFVVVLLACEVAPFTDVPTDHPFCPEIAYLADGNVTTGYPDGTFHPAAPITRQGFVAQLTRLLVMPT